MKKLCTPEKVLATAINRLIAKEPFWARLIASVKIEILLGSDKIWLNNLTILVGEELISTNAKETKPYVLDTSVLETLILGSILKIGLLHLIRGNEKDPIFWNAACNIYISRLLSREGYVLPKDVAPFVAEFSLDLRDEEAIYQAIASRNQIEIDNFQINLVSSNANDNPQNNHKSKVQKNGSVNQKNDDQSESDTGSANENDAETKTRKLTKQINALLGEMHRRKLDSSESDDSDLTNIHPSNSEFNYDGHDAQDSSLTDEQLEKVVYQMLMMGNKVGDTPSYLGEKITNLRKTNFGLRTVLQKFVHDNYEPDRYNWMRPERRFHDADFLIPQLQGDRLGICIAFDTSGSCYDVVKRILGVIYEVNEMTYGGEFIHLLYCDCGEPQHQVWTKKSDMPFIENGGGGTSYAPVMDWVIAQNRKYPEKIKNLLYITDAECHTYGKNPGIPVTWIILDIYGNGEKMGNQITFGKKIIVSPEQIAKFMSST